MLGLVCFGCDPAKVDGSDNTTNPNTTNIANVTISNFITIDPRALTFKFYNQAAPSVDGTVEYSTTKIAAGDIKTFKVPAGSYRLGFIDETGSKTPLMPSLNAVFNADAWPVKTFAKDSSYSLTLFTDNGNNYWLLQKK